jgi:amino acid adenylation domain-containing protein
MPLHTAAVNPVHEQLPVFDIPAPRIIAEQARLRPDAVALVQDSERWSYGDLEHTAARLASQLRSRGAGPGTIVALALTRSPEFVAAALGIMKCGAAYLPMDLTHPTERLRFMLRDAGARILVTEDIFLARFANTEIDIVSLDAEWDAFGEQSAHPAEAELEPDQLAYVIYTSGSTGEPKGVEVTQRNLSNLIGWHARAFDLDECDRASALAGVGFDAAVWEIWPYLALGATIYLPDKTTRLSAEKLRDWMVANRITISFAPTALAEQLIALKWPHHTALRFLLTGADTLHRYPRPFLPFKLVNNYGPTECTVVATSGIVPPGRDGDTRPAIGSAIDNVHIHILDEQKREVPDGTAGEIHIGGAGVARGYRNRRELTEERFVNDPLSESGGRIYRTGDFGRRLPNGEIAFIGREDDQVKIRGYRVELGEINFVLSRHPAVRASIVTARDDVPGEKQLVAYVVPAQGARCDEKILRETIREKLPECMEPSAFVWMERLPLTANGKIDRAALSAPSRDESEFTPPRTVTEDRLAGIVTEFLKVPRVSVTDDFFHLGAHSLLGAQIVARVRHVFGADLRLIDVFEAPSVAQLSMKIEEALTHQLAEMSEAEVEAALATE